IIDEHRIDEYNDISGHGVQAIVDGKKILAGNAKLMDKYDIPFKAVEEVGTIVYLAIEGAYAGCLLIADMLKDDAAEGMALIKETGVEHMIMLTGDSKAVAESVGNKLGIDEVHSEHLPQDKVKKMEGIMAYKLEKEKIAFVDDGI